MSMDPLKTPVVFIIFNRPETTELVFNEIRKAKPETLYVIADGPRPHIPGETERCAKTREIIDRVDWECIVQKSYSDKNMGCKLRIATGLNWVFEHIEEAIILEDDCLPDLSFFYFCEYMLKRFRQDTRVMMIAGTNYLFEKDNITESYYFSRYFSIWGWATWRRAWRLFDVNMVTWPECKSEGYLNNIYSNRLLIKYFKLVFDGVYSGREDTWDAQWFYACLVNNGYSVVSKHNLVANIGAQGTRPQRISMLNMPVNPIDIHSLLHPPVFLPNPKCEQIESANILKMNRFSRIKWIVILLLKWIRMYDILNRK